MPPRPPKMPLSRKKATKRKVKPKAKPKAKSQPKAQSKPKKPPQHQLGRAKPATPGRQPGQPSSRGRVRGPMTSDESTTVLEFEADTPVLILRFRDLVDPTPGHTIDEHNCIIQKRAYCWWGWWRKPRETIPTQLWADLIGRAKLAEGGLPLLLVDSGRRKLFCTKLLSISFQPGHDSAPVPEDSHHTPRYYTKYSSGASVFASWFKLGEAIKEVPESILHELVYERVPHDDVVPVTESQIVGKRISAISHLLTFGNVTYWVGKKAVPTARKAGALQVIVSDPLDVTHHLRVDSNVILHLSDIHVGGKHAWSAGDRDASDTTLGDAIISSIKAASPGLVLVTGDLTWKGSLEEFQQAFECLDDIRSKLGVPRTHFVIIPGNHDLGWIRDGAASGSWDGTYRMANAAACENYRKFYGDWYGVDADSDLAIGRRLFLVGGDTVDLLGLNSAAFQQVEGAFAGVGQIPRKVIERTFEAMSWGSDSPRATHRRFLLMHHHLLPVVSEEEPQKATMGFGVAHNAGQILRMLAEHGVDLVVHGHQHQPFAAVWREGGLGDYRASHPLHILGGGSAGVQDGDLGPIKQRCFNLIRVGFGRLDVSLFTTGIDRRVFVENLPRLYTDYSAGWIRTADSSGSG